MRERCGWKRVREFVALVGSGGIYEGSGYEKGK